MSDKFLVSIDIMVQRNRYYPEVRTESEVMIE